MGRAALSYVTGSHSAKVGMTWHDGAVVRHHPPVQLYMGLQLFNGVPPSVVLNTNPYTTTTNVNADMGIYAQDRWTMRRLTLTGGVRFDYFNIGIPAQSAAASRWVGARSFAAIDNIPNWKDLSPRVGVSYDLFGNGKTAIKATVSRYVAGNTVFNLYGPDQSLVEQHQFRDARLERRPNGNPRISFPKAIR